MSIQNSPVVSLIHPVLFYRAQLSTPLIYFIFMRTCVFRIKYSQMPPIGKLDGSINTLKNCERLALSTNSIPALVNMSGCTNLKILSVGRNALKKISELESVAGTLEELWCSYNHISALDGINCCHNLTTLYISNNLIKDWSQLDKLVTTQHTLTCIYVYIYTYTHPYTYTYIYVYIHTYIYI